MADLGRDVNASPAAPAQVTFVPVGGYDAVAGVTRPAAVDGAGRFQTVPGALTALGPTPAPTPVAPLAVSVPLPPAPPGAVYTIVQNDGLAGSLVVVRELAGLPGAGITLPRFAVFVFDGAPALEVDNPTAIVASVQITWEF